MIDTIKKALLAQGVDIWRINREELHSCELYFIKRNLDSRRIIETTKYSVTVFKDFEKRGKKYRGSSSVQISPDMDEDIIASKIKDAFFAASYVENLFYELPQGVCENETESSIKAASMNNIEVCNKMVKALYAADKRNDSWINSAEFYVNKKVKSIISSTGFDVTYTEYDINGEFVVQTKTPKDVELHQQFAFSDLESEALTLQVQKALDTVLARAKAEMAPQKGKYNVILSEKSMRTLFSYYEERSHVGYIYPGYSDWKIGEQVQGEKIIGEKVNLTLVAKTPYSSEGILMNNLDLIENGFLKNLHGSARISYYLNVKPTGEYEAIKSDNGSISLNEMKKEPYLHVVSFSDFQMDAESGYFGGEIRLAYLFNGENVIPVSGGSINGNFIELQKNMVFSKERYIDKYYDGPMAVRFMDVSVAGE